MSETKKEIRARINELNLMILHAGLPEECLNTLTGRLNELESELISAPQDMVESVMSSHQSLCSIKEMGEKDAFGHDPAIFYSLALSGEVGELSNKLVKVIRKWGSFEEKKEAIESEIADVFIYACLLAFTSDIDPHLAVSQKCDIVEKRAREGYYGGALSEHSRSK